MPQDDTVKIRPLHAVPPVRVSDLALYLANSDAFMASGDGPLRPRAAAHGQRWHNQLGTQRKTPWLRIIIWLSAGLLLVLAMLLA